MTAAKTVDPKLKEFATPRQAEYLDAILKHGGISAAARVLKVHKSTIARRVDAVKRRAALQGYSPAHDLTHPAPAPFNVKGVSTLYNGSGEVAAQWVKTTVDQSQMQQVVRELIESMAEGVIGKSPGIKQPAHIDADLLAVYPMGDPHYGLYAWAAEAGEDFDLNIAERLTKAAIDRLVDSAPPAETAIILELGDFFHADDNTARTPTHGFQLDVDTRWARVMQIGLRSMVYVVERAAAKHKTVIVKIEEGNHDPHSYYALALALDCYFRNNPRIKVDLSPAAHWYYRFGKVLIGSTHGDKTKMVNLPGVMAADRPQDWGETNYRYWYAGHIHHIEVREFPGVICETFRTLAARDAYHSGRGYRAGRDMCAIIHHKDFGEIERHRCDIARIQ